MRDLKRERPQMNSRMKKPMVFRSEHGDDFLWKDSMTGKELRCRKTFGMTATPLIQEDGNQAVAEIKIEISETADEWDGANRTWKSMDNEKFAQLLKDTTERDRISLEVSASITKTIDPTTGRTKIQKVSALGYDGNDPRKDWSISENGISIKLDWQDDLLIVKWNNIERAKQNLDPIESTFAIPFSERFSN